MPFRILLAVDDSPMAINAARVAVERFGLPSGQCSLDIMHCHYPIPPRAASALGREIVTAYYRDETAQALRGVQEFLDARGVDYRTVAKVGMPAAQIARYAEGAGTDLVVMGTHGRGAAKSLLLGSVAQGVMAECDVPVMLVREAKSVKREAPVLVAVDGSAYTKRAIEWLLRQRDIIVGAREVVLVNVVPDEGVLPRALGKQRTRAVQDAQFEQAMSGARRQCERARIAWREVCDRGDPGASIVAQAERLSAGLIVMGSHGRGGMTSLILGSVTQRTLAAARVPVLVVR